MTDRLPTKPEVRPTQTADGSSIVEVVGAWTLRNLQPVLTELKGKLAATPKSGWDLRQIDALDNAGAVLLWRAWGKHRPAVLFMRGEHEALFFHLDALTATEPQARKIDWLAPVAGLGNTIFALGELLHGLTRLIGQLTFDLAHLWRHPSRIPWREISANFFRAGPQAMPIMALVGFLVGVVFAYLSSQQLHSYGAEVLIINTLGNSVLREFGPVLTAVLFVGRTGSAVTAQIGAMRAAQELDAMAVIGIPQGVRLILPKVVALTLALPLTVLWTDAMALAGGAIAADVQMNVHIAYFLSRLPYEVAVTNLWLGIAKGAVFGFLISLISCHFGLRIRPNTESMRVETTNSVVTSIAAVMVVDAVFAILFFDVGIK